MSRPSTEEVLPTRLRPPFRPYIPLMVITCIIWGAAFPITRPGLADVPPATFAFARFLLAALVLLPVMLVKRGGWHFQPGDWKWVGLAGLLGFTVIQICQNWGLTLSSASDISVLAATEPVTISLMAALFLGEKPATSVWLGLFISMGGVWLVLGLNPLALFNPSVSAAGSSVAGSSAAGSLPYRVLGDLIFLAGTLGFSSYNVISRRLNQRNDGLEFVTGAVLFGLAGLAPICLLELSLATRPVNWSGPAIGGILYAGLLVTVFGFLALSWSLKRVAAARVALLFYMQPVAGVFVAWLLGEHLSLNFFAGAALILTGVYIAERGSA